MTFKHMNLATYNRKWVAQACEYLMDLEAEHLLIMKDICN